MCGKGGGGAGWDGQSYVTNLRHVFAFLKWAQTYHLCPLTYGMFAPTNLWNVCAYSLYICLHSRQAKDIICMSILILVLHIQLILGPWMSLVPHTRNDSSRVTPNHQCIKQRVLPVTATTRASPYALTRRCSTTNTPTSSALTGRDTDLYYTSKQIASSQMTLQTYAHVYTYIYVYT